MRILVVEDDNIKFGKIFRALEADGVRREDVVHSITASDAYDEISRSQFDLMLLDINLPRRVGELPQRGAGMSLLNTISRNETVRLPTYIVGITAFEDVIAEFGEAFADSLWSLVWYSDTSDRWISQLRTKVRYIQAAKRSMNFSDGVTYGVDFAVVCALASPELSAVKQLPLDWQPLRLAHDETRYFAGSISDGATTLSIVAASAPRMGMPASSVLASKMIHQFRPRYLIMPGICAGRSEKVKIGDIIVADPSWDWGSGKIVGNADESKFLPLPHQLDLDVDVAACVRDLCLDSKTLARIRASANGTKPDHDLSAHVGPLASGAAVIASASTVGALLEDNRGLLGIEMEAYGVATAAAGSGKPRPHALIMKSVCDFADEKKADDYQEYAASVSAGFMLQLMTTLPRP